MIFFSASLCLSWDLQPGSLDTVQRIQGHAGHEVFAYLLQELPEQPAILWASCVFSSAKSRKRADGNMEGIVLG